MTRQEGHRRACRSVFRISCAPCPRSRLVPHARLPRAFAARRARRGRDGAGPRGVWQGQTRRTRRTAKPTPIGQLNTAAMTLARVDFCSLLPDEAVRTALGGGLGDQASWRNGDTALIDIGTRDVAHEYGCAWNRQQYAAAAWIYARPITTEFAQAVLDKTARRPGCTADAGTGVRHAAPASRPAAARRQQAGPAGRAVPATPTSPARCRDRRGVRGGSRRPHRRLVRAGRQRDQHRPLIAH